MPKRRRREIFFKRLMQLSLLLVVGLLIGVIVAVLIRGTSALSVSMLLDTPQGGYYLGGEGGIANAIAGSLYLAFGASLLALLLSLPISFALQKEYAGSRLAHLSRIILEVLWGTPSIVYGAVGFIVMVYFGVRASLLGGILVLTLLTMPIMIRSMDEILRMVPVELKEIAVSLGATRLETAWIVFRQVLPGIVTAVILAFGRAIGDAASILFTAGYTDAMPRSLTDPVASLPLAIFFQIGTPLAEVQDRAYAAALVLLIIVLVVNVAARMLSDRFSRNVIR
ncbi:MAG TPA: ABC transporter permease subunit [Smithellaceae bacterium]|nr:ABC transporter permease subunit [Smithellaceae bacterium]